MISGKVVDVNYEYNIVYFSVSVVDSFAVGKNFVLKPLKEPRTESQNAIYWVFLNWLIDNHLKNFGHFSAQAFHDNLKQHFKKDYNDLEISTKDFDTAEFNRWIEKINLFVIEFFGIDTSQFWEGTDYVPTQTGETKLSANSDSL